MDLAPYPIVRMRDCDGLRCACVGVAAAGQRASRRNDFPYGLERAGAGSEGARRTVELEVVFKDP